MPIDQRHPRATHNSAANPGSEVLIQCAQNFLIDIGRAAQQADSLGLLRPAISRFREDHETPSKVALVATPTDDLASILIRSNGGTCDYTLRMHIPGGVYSQDADVTDEEVSVTGDHKAMVVRVFGDAPKRHYFRWVEEVSDPVKARMLEAFVSGLRPISSNEYSRIHEQHRIERAQRNKLNIAQKIARFLGAH